MGIRVALHHKTVYNYDRLVTLGPQVVRLRPAPHSRTPVISYSLRVEPKEHFINWQQDPQSNFLARIVINDIDKALLSDIVQWRPQAQSQSQSQSRTDVPANVVNGVH